MRPTSWILFAFTWLVGACASDAPTPAGEGGYDSGGTASSFNSNAAGAAGAAQSAGGVSGTTSAAQGGGRSGGGLAGEGGQPGAAAAGGASTANWWNEAYKQRLRIDVDNTDGLVSLVDVPILIPLDPSRFHYADAAPDGHDLRFVTRENELLSHEVEQWVPGGVSSIWVKLPRLDAAGKTELILYFANPDAEPLPPSAAQAVWSNGYAGVWHLSDASDATGHHPSLESKTAFVAGAIGSAATFDGSTEYVALPGGNYVSGSSAVTFSGWLRHRGSQPDGKGVMLAIGTEAAAGHASWTSVTFTDNGVVGEANPDEATRAEAPSGAGSYANDTWSAFTVVIDVAGKRITHYKDGAAIGAPYRGAWSVSAFKDLPSHRASIGTEEDRGAHWFVGLLDELRLETVARTPAWVAAQAHAQKADWLSFFAPETL